jgi:hypothetical protein
MYQTNPIQQRIELLADKWNEAVINVNGRVIRIIGNDDEQDFIEAFFQYMLALDSSTDDIALLFETPMNTAEDFSGDLLKELEVMIEQWNNSKKPEDFKFNAINWVPDYTLTDKNNPAALFIRNLNQFAQYLLKDDDRLLTVVIYFYSQDNELKSYWLTKAIEADINPYIRIAVVETDTQPVFNSVADNFKQKVISLNAELNADTALSQMAAMGDPADPGTSYRYSYVLLMQAITQRNEDDVKHHSDKCIEIAQESIKQNPYWIMQLVVIYTALANHFMGNKNFNAAIEQATLAIKASEDAQGMIEDSLAARMKGQSYILRASLWCVMKKWEPALKDAIASCNNYSNSKDIILLIESLRMCGYISHKNGDNKDAIDYYLHGLKTGCNLPVESAVGSSLPLLLNQLLQLNYQSRISYPELDAVVRPIFGDNWEEILDNYMNIEKSNMFNYA